MSDEPTSGYADAGEQEYNADSVPEPAPGNTDPLTETHDDYVVNTPGDDPTPDYSDNLDPKSAP